MFGDNRELRYALRSLDKHFMGDFEVVLLTSREVPWISGVKRLDAKGLKNAVRTAGREYPDGFFWWYDDLCLLRDTTPEDLMRTPCCKGWIKASTSWARDLDRVRARLEKEGYKAWDYSRPHGPYWFDGSMVEEGFADWPGMAGKFPWETWILSKRDWPRAHGGRLQYYGAFKRVPSADHYLLNYNNDGNTQELRDWLAERFPDRSRFESHLPEWERVFFVHVPKTAGKSVISALDGVVDVESRDRHLPWSNNLVSAAWNRTGKNPVVACVREPVDRAVSVYRYFLGRDFPPKDEPHRVLREMFRCMGFSKFWEQADVGYISSVVKHLRPQHSFLDGAPVSMLMRFEDLPASFDRLCGKLGESRELPCENASSGGVPRVSPLAIEHIRNFYAEDFKKYYPAV